MQRRTSSNTCLKGHSLHDAVIYSGKVICQECRRQWRLENPRPKKKREAPAVSPRAIPLPAMAPGITLDRLMAGR